VSHERDFYQGPAAGFGAKVLQFDWCGRYPKKRNWVLPNCALANAWVLFLDADEFLDDSFCDEKRVALFSWPTKVAFAVGR
jgi:hypothetical protein